VTAALVLRNILKPTCSTRSSEPSSNIDHIDND
jgi:hypothetical protein